MHVYIVYIHISVAILAQAILAQAILAEAILAQVPLNVLHSAWCHTRWISPRWASQLPSSETCQLLQVKFSALFVRRPPLTLPLNSFWCGLIMFRKLRGREGHSSEDSAAAKQKQRDKRRNTEPLDVEVLHESDGSVSSEAGDQIPPEFKWLDKRNKKRSDKVQRSLPAK